MKKEIIHFTLLGLCFLLFEYFARCISYDTNYFHPALLLMLVVGGVATRGLGLLNSNAWVNKHINIFWQSVIGCAFILLVEYFSGCLLNIVFKLNVWDYTAYPLNLNGQVCFCFGVVWLFLCPFGFWLDDWLRWYIFENDFSNQHGFMMIEKPKYTLLEIYKEFFQPFAKPFI